MRKSIFILIFVVSMCVCPLLASSSDRAFMELCKSGTVSEIEKAIQAGADFYSADQNGITPLMNAARYNKNPDVILLLIKKGAQVNIRESRGYGYTPLLFAAAYNNARVVEALVKNGADLNVTDRGSNYTALRLAARQNDNPTVVAELIRSGANFRPKRGEQERAVWMNTWALNDAAESNNTPATLANLIQAGFDVNVMIDGIFQRTPLMSAAERNGNPQITEFLIKAGARVNQANKEGQTALMFAMNPRHKNPEIARILLSNGADVKLKDKSGRTAIDYASDEMKKTDVFRSLLRALEPLPQNWSKNWSPS